MPKLTDYKAELKRRQAAKEDLLRQIELLTGQRKHQKAQRRKRELLRVEKDIDWLEQKIHAAEQQKQQPSYKQVAQEEFQKIKRKIEAFKEPSYPTDKHWTSGEIREELSKLRSDSAHLSELLKDITTLWPKNRESVLSKATETIVSFTVKTKMNFYAKEIAVLEEKLKETAEREHLTHLPLDELEKLKNKEELIDRIIELRQKRKPKVKGKSEAERIMATRKKILKEKDTIIAAVTQGKPEEQWTEEQRAEVTRVQNYYANQLEQLLSR